MSTIVTIDKAGRVIIPKPLRDEMHLEPGDSLALEWEGESVTLRPVRTHGRLHKKHGIWVLHTGELITTEETNAVLRSLREGRGKP